MRFIIEVDGVVLNQRPAYTALHQSVAKTIGWSHLSASAFWRTLRKGDRSAIVPAAPPSKMAEYEKLFAQRQEEDELISSLHAQEGAADALRVLSGHGTLCYMTTGVNHARRAELLASCLEVSAGVEVHALSVDARKRPGELKHLAGSEKRCMVVASTDSLLRAAELAEVFAVGISTGVCNAARLHQSGADIVYPRLADLADSIRSGASDLIRAGLLPAPLG